MSRTIVCFALAAVTAVSVTIADQVHAFTASYAGGADQAHPDHLAVIVNVSNPITNVSLTELRALALIQRTHWPDGRKVTLALHEPGPLERRAVLELVYKMTEAGFSKYFLQATFTGQVAAGPRQLSTSENVKRFVENVPGALGFVRLPDVDTTVKSIRVDGRQAGAAGYCLVLSHDLQP